MAAQPNGFTAQAQEAALQHAIEEDNIRPVHSRRTIDFEELVAAALEDVNRPGLKHRMKRRLGSKADLQDIDGMLSSKDHSHKQTLVKQVLETGGGDNEVFARKLHARFDRVGLKQPSVEVRFDNLTVSSEVMEGMEGGIFTVGIDLISKVMGAVAAVTRKKPPMKKVNILHNVSGVLKPGQITLVLGPPGGGKSTLMKALLNQAPANVEGSITYNGHTFDEFNVTRTARYVSQTDLHNPQLTVRETMQFSARCQGAGYNPDLLRLLEKKEAEKGIIPDPDVAKLMAHLSNGVSDVSTVLTLQLLSLDNCADTIVGDGMTRGVSGGEKKRVTSAEMMVGPSKVLFMDEISTGLDSASTFTIVQSLANWAHATDATVTVALLQPEPQTYDLFDNILLLAAGRIMYHGPREAVLPHFASLGFECPPNKAVADFLQELVSRKDQPALRAHPGKFEPTVDFVPAAAFAAAFKRTQHFAATRATLDKPFDKSQSHPASLLKSKFGVPAWDALKALTWRESILLTRNRQGQKYRYIQMFILATICCLMYLRGEVTGDDTFQDCSNALGAIWFSIAYMQFLGLAECAEQLQRLPVFYKQRANLFFPPWADAIPAALVKLPIMFLEVTFWSLFVYWVVGLEANAGRFFTFWGTLLLLQIYSSSLYRFIGSTVRAIVTGTSIAVLTMLATFMGSGFVLLRPQIPDWWIWLYWLSPLQYTLTGLVNNEFSGKSYSEPYAYNKPGVDDTLGQAFITSYGVPQGNWFRYLAPLVLIAWAVALNLMNMAALTFLPPPGAPPPAPPPFEPDYELTESVHTNPTYATDAAHTGPPETRSSSGHTSVAVSVDMHKSGDDSKHAAGAAKPAGQKLSEMPFEPITLAFSDIHYYVPTPGGPGELELLKGVSGLFEPGVLTALMGASGAGKTTLMDVLTDRKTTGRTTGQVLVNGFAKDKATFARVSGYCEQFDTHSPGTTVEEAIRFSAALRLARSISEEQRGRFVAQVMEIVELEPIAGLVVGLPGMFGLSGEQFKRLTIAVELAANPAIIFMDEPTSGLDARAAQIVMRVVRNIVSSGRTIVCTIHQPSAEIFFSFDEVLLLKRGGWPIYYGPLGHEGSTLVAHFQSVPGVKPMKHKYNPATYMLEVSSASEEERLGVKFADIFTRDIAPGVDARVAPHLLPKPGAHQITLPDQYSTSRWTQYTFLLMRNVRNHWRSPPYNTTRLVLTVLAAALLGSFYWSRGDNYSSTNDVLAVMGALFVSILFLGFVNFQLVIPMFLFERPAFYRERAAGMYAVFPWVTSFVDAEVPWAAVQSVLLSCIVYFMINFELEVGKFFFFLLVVFLMLLIFTYLGMLAVAATPTLIMGITFGAMAQGFWFLFAGFLIPKPLMPHWLQWFWYLTPPAWGIYALVADQLGDKDNLIALADGTEITISNYIKDTFDYHYDLRWMAVGILAAFVFVMRMALTCTIKFLNFQNR